jgi:hypothetical protein
VVSHHDLLQGIRPRCTCFGMIVLSTSIWGCRFCCFMRRRRWWWWAWWWDGTFGVSCGCGDVSFFVFSGLGVGGDGIFCVSCGCGDASFSVFLG